MDAASAQTKQLDSKAKQAKQQMEDLKNAQDDGQPDLPAAGAAADRQQQREQQSARRVCGGHSECGHAQLAAAG